MVYRHYVVAVDCCMHQHFPNEMRIRSIESRDSMTHRYEMITICRAAARDDDVAEAAATLHLNTSRDVTSCARLGGDGGAPGMQAGLLEPKNKPVQVLSGRGPGQAARGGREKCLRATFRPKSVRSRQNRRFEMALRSRYRNAPRIKTTEHTKK